MSAQVIDLHTGRLLNGHGSTAPIAPPVTASEAVAEVRDLIASAYALVRSARAARDLVQADALLEGLSDALAAATAPGSVGVM